MSFQTQHDHFTHYTPEVLANVTASGKTHKPERKWHYLLSDTLRFNDDQTQGIRIQKPAKDLVFDYCVKIVAQQQVDTLYVEQHTFTASELFNLTMLCKNKRVNLVHLSKTAHKQTNNVVYGPW